MPRLRTGVSWSGRYSTVRRLPVTDDQGIDPGPLLDRVFFFYYNFVITATFQKTKFLGFASLHSFSKESEMEKINRRSVLKATGAALAGMVAGTAVEAQVLGRRRFRPFAQPVGFHFLAFSLSAPIGCLAVSVFCRRSAVCLLPIFHLCADGWLYSFFRQAGCRLP